MFSIGSHNITLTRPFQDFAIFHYFNEKLLFVNDKKGTGYSMIFNTD